MLENRVERYLELKAQTKVAEAEMKQIRTYFSENLSTILEARGEQADATLLTLPCDIQFEYRVREKTRNGQSTDYEALSRFPDAYAASVNGWSTSYIEIRKVSQV